MKSLPPLHWTNPVHVLAFGFGAGAFKSCPGTVGTAVAIPFYLLAEAFLSLPVYLVTLALLALVGIWLCQVTAQDLGVHDHPGIVWDEMVGYWLTMAAAPAGWPWVIGGFVLFRLFDIWKPWPIRWVDERVTGGAGIMLDDILAAAYAWLCLTLVAKWV